MSKAKAIIWRVVGVGVGVAAITYGTFNDAQFIGCVIGSISIMTGVMTPALSEIDGPSYRIPAKKKKQFKSDYEEYQFYKFVNKK